ncbi:DUF1003 domain-containing protein [Polynucleobacter sp. 39-46-10]|jgi:uncharacterized membrane protein|uniref:DUF1003 domain-containing protein n=1 Tax=Polynucleobacter sp. 39-46-10 TaxID=1970428 RepID=UPI000BD44285|nr:DUF1003 domain-containing protein [Polynucleobacter sp. 39-46-10]OZA77721.1 MAG: hypothetical protein B7X71_03840 [Polynucleobacter sp. 39-46-10]
MISDSADNKQVNQNIEAVLDFYAHEDEKMSFAQRLLERISCFIGKPIFLALILLFVVLWIAGNLLLPVYSIAQFDPPPFHFLQGIIGLSALLTATIVVSNQNRLAKIEEQRAHLDLKVNLLTEQKTAKMIDLLEELRFDLPNVKNRPDSEATELKHAMNPGQVLAALDERTEMDASQKNIANTQVVGIDGHKLT